MPRIGLLSDSHGRAVITRLGVSALVESGAELLIHLGDVGTVEVIDELAVERPETSVQIPARLVFGNTDWDDGPLSEYARHLGVQVDHPAGEIALDRGELFFCHGHQVKVMNAALARNVRYLCHGHTHQASDRKSGGTRIINPGALCRAHRYTVAVLDTDTDELTFITVQAR